MKFTVQSLVDSFRGTSSPPIMFIKINNAINDPQSSLIKVGKVISEDSSLSARLLKLVNSSFYGFPKRIGSISEAVFLVGSHQIRDLALVTTMMKVFDGIPKDIVNMEMFWLHSLAVGVGAKAIAESMGESQLERFFVAGVLHDIGRLILYSRAPSESRKILERASQEKRFLVEIEYEELNFSHTEIGRALIDAWKLPSFFNEITEYHHAPEKAMHYPIETAVVHLADVLVHALQYGSSGELYVPKLKNESWDKLNLSQFQLPKIIKMIDRDVKAVAHLLHPHTEK